MLDAPVQPVEFRDENDVDLVDVRKEPLQLVTVGTGAGYAVIDIFTDDCLIMLLCVFPKRVKLGGDGVSLTGLPVGTHTAVDGGTGHAWASLSIC